MAVDPKCTAVNVHVYHPVSSPGPHVSIPAASFNALTALPPFRLAACRIDVEEEVVEEVEVAPEVAPEPEPEPEPEPRPEPEGMWYGVGGVIVWGR